MKKAVFLARNSTARAFSVEHGDNCALSERYWQRVVRTMRVTSGTCRCSDNDKNHADVPKRLAIYVGCQDKCSCSDAVRQQAFKPAVRRNGRLLILLWVGRATVNVNVLSLFHMKQLRSPASYRRGRGALFLPTVPVPPPKTLFSASARLCTGFRLFYCNTAHRPFNYLCRTIVAWSIEIGGWQIGCQVSRETPVLALPYRAAKSHAFTVWGMTTTSLRYALCSSTLRTDCFT